MNSIEFISFLDFDEIFRSQNLYPKLDKLEVSNTAESEKEILQDGTAPADSLGLGMRYSNFAHAG